MENFREISEGLANKDQAAKKLAKKKAKARKMKKCKGNMTPSLVTNGTSVKAVCTPKDKKRGKIMKKVAKKLKANKSAMRMRNKKAAATKEFRKD